MPEVETVNKGVLRLNLWDWLKKSPQSPIYSSSLKKADKEAQSKLGAFKEEADVHEYFRFYDASFVRTPEFSYLNKYETVKSKDAEVLIKHLENLEADLARQ